MYSTPPAGGFGLYSVFGASGKGEVFKIVKPSYLWPVYSRGLTNKVVWMQRQQDSQKRLHELAKRFFYNYDYHHPGKILELKIVYLGSGVIKNRGEQKIITSYRKEKND